MQGEVKVRLACFDADADSKCEIAYIVSDISLHSAINQLTAFESIRGSHGLMTFLLLQLWHILIAAFSDMELFKSEPSTVLPGKLGASLSFG